MFLTDALLYSAQATGLSSAKYQQEAATPPCRGGGARFLQKVWTAIQLAYSAPTCPIVRIVRLEV